MSLPPSVAQIFFGQTASLKQSQIDWLVKRHSIPILALVQDGDGIGWPIGAARVERVGQRFDFRPEDGVGAFVVVARDEDGFGQDLVAWAPKDGWVASWADQVSILGQHELLAPRMGEPLCIHRGMLSWLQGGRNGAVILNRSRARRLLEGLTLQAEDVEHGLILRRALEPPAPKIMVRAVDEKAAA